MSSDLGFNQEISFLIDFQLTNGFRRQKLLIKD